MKHAVFTVMLPEYEPGEALNLLRELGYDGVEWRVTKPNAQAGLPPSYWSNNRCTLDIATIDRDAVAVGRLVRAAGLETAALGTYMGLGDLGDVERAMRAAAEMGCPRIRVSPLRYDRAVGYARLFARSLEGYIEVERLSRKYGVQACLEIHLGNICSSPSLARRLVEHLDPRHIGVILDPGNMVYEGYEEWRMGMELLGPYLTHVHIKNAQWSVVGRRPTGEPEWKASAAALDQGVIDMHQLMTDLRAVGYDGWLSQEDFSETGTTREKLARNIAYLRTL